MGAHSHADINRVSEVDCDRPGRGRTLSGLRGVNRKPISAPFDTDLPRGCERRPDLLCCRAHTWPILERGQAVTVQSDVGVSGVRREALANHQHRFSMSRRPGTDELNIGGESEVSRAALPGKLESIEACPNVVKAAKRAVAAAIALVSV